MANTLRFKRGLVATIPTAVAGEPLFTTDTFDLYIGNGTNNTRFQKYIASGSTSQLLRGDGSLLTMPIVLTSPSNGQVLKYNGTNWVNDSDAGVTGSGTTNYLPKWTSGSALGNSNLINDASGNLGLGVVPSAWRSTDKALQINTYTSISSNNAGDTQLINNAFFNSIGSAIYSNTGKASRYEQYQGVHAWYNAPSGTAGNAITFTQAMTLTAGGRLLLGTTSDDSSFRLQVSGGVLAADYNGTDNVNLVAQNINTNGTVLTLNSKGTGGIIALQTNTTERLRITSGGNVGIGTTSPSDLLHIGNTTTGGNLRIVSSGYGSNGIARFFGTDNAEKLQIGALGTNESFIYTPSGISLSIYAGATERLRITSGGNVGIGTTSPQNDSGYKGLTLNGTTGAQLGFMTNGTLVSNIYSDATSGLNLVTATVVPISLYTNGAERMRITSAGSVGIGTTSPAGFFTIAKSVNSGTADVLYLSNPSQTGVTAASLNFINADSVIKSSIAAAVFGNDYMTFNVGSNTERMRITSAGNVGIGRIAPDYLLEVNNSIKSFGSFVSDGNGSVAANFYATGQIVSGASDQPSLYLDTTWNTTGNARGIEFNVNNTSSGASSKLLNLKVDNATMFNVSKGGAITTSAPTGYAAKPYKLGEVLTNAATADRSIVVEIDGTVYYLLASTTAP
jgi:hypothetical protein